MAVSPVQFRLRVDPRATIVSGRDLLGRFTSSQVEVKKASDRMALNVARMQADYLIQVKVKGTGRPQRGTLYLPRALLDERNRRATLDGFEVGIESWLDSSQASAYWRGLEEGTSVHVGDVFGFFVLGGSIPGRIVRPTRSWREEGTGGRLVQVSKEKATYRLGNGRVVQSVIRIRKPIPAYDYMGQGVRNWLASGDQTAQMDQALRDFRARGELQIRR